MGVRLGLNEQQVNEKDQNDNNAFSKKYAFSGSASSNYERRNIGRDGHAANCVTEDSTAASGVIPAAGAIRDVVVAAGGRAASIGKENFHARKQDKFKS